MDLKSVSFPSVTEKDYQQRLAILQHQLAQYQQMIYLNNEKMVIAVEGTDASGKGGMVKSLIQAMDPRGYQVHCIGAPYGHELQEHYLQRFWRRIPRNGNIAIFDRTWYGRVLIERIELNLPDTKWTSAYQEIHAFEQQLVNEGYLLVKLFLHISEDEQKKRFINRLSNPDKCWKLTESDLTTRLHWEAYQRAYQHMIDQADLNGKPWCVIPANNKFYSRLHAMEAVVEKCRQRYGEPELSPLKPGIRTMAEKMGLIAAPPSNKPK